LAPLLGEVPNLELKAREGGEVGSLREPAEALNGGREECWDRAEADLSSEEAGCGDIIGNDQRGGCRPATLTRGQGNGEPWEAYEIGCLKGELPAAARSMLRAGCALRSG